MNVLHRADTVNAYHELTVRLSSQPRTWLVTGAAGFIGSNLLEALLRLDQRVIGLDNFSTGSEQNLQEVRALVGPALWSNYVHVRGDTRDPETCKGVIEGVDYVLHQAALGSVPRSLAKPLDSHSSNVTGFINMLAAAKAAGVKRFVYASSSSVYGDHPDLPKVEHKTGACLSPYAATKVMNELYAGVFARCYGIETMGLRYFNVFGPRQDPDGPYAAVIPKWIAALLQGEPVWINGDGQTSRDFCYVVNVVQVNLLAATTDNPAALNQVYNVAVHARTTLNELFQLLTAKLAPFSPGLQGLRPRYREFRPGDVMHSEADISQARTLLGYEPTHSIHDGLTEAIEWYCQKLGPTALRQAAQPAIATGTYS
jgi:UDP-N-acetylglucosamine/UDP-N-acetyl-alpha-D-glucosaminouronate 4-epimerase